MYTLSEVHTHALAMAAREIQIKAYLQNNSVHMQLQHYKVKHYMHLPIACASHSSDVHRIP